MIQSKNKAATTKQSSMKINSTFDCEYTHINIYEATIRVLYAQ